MTTGTKEEKKKVCFVRGCKEVFLYNQGGLYFTRMNKSVVSGQGVGVTHL